MNVLPDIQFWDASIFKTTIQKLISPQVMGAKASKANTRMDRSFFR